MATPIASSDSSPEYTTMIEYKEKLIATLSEHVGDVSTFSSKLVIYKLISSIPSASSEGAQTSTEHTKDYRAQKIVSEVTANIKDDPTMFQKFVQFLSEHPQLQGISQELKKGLETSKQHNKPIADPNASPDYNVLSSDLQKNLPNKYDSKSHEQLPCLGRPFKLGMFYDCHKDNLILNINICKESVPELKDDEPHTSVNYKVIPSDNLQDKAIQLGLTPGLQLSLLAGLVQDISGSAKYWNDLISSQRVVRVCLKYESTSYVKQLAVDKLGDIQCNTFDAATHVVTRVLYGLRIVFVFDRELSQGEDYNYVHGNMVKMVTNLSRINDADHEDSSFFDTLLAETEEVNKYKCKVHSDLKELRKDTCTLPDVVEAYKSLAKLNPPRRDEDQTIPQKVWLFPLSQLDDKGEVIAQPLGTGLIDQIQTMSEYFYDTEIQASDILSKHSPILSKFNHLQERLTKFSDIIVVHRNETKKSLAEKLPLIREKKVDEAELSKIVKEASASPFSSQHLSSWLTQVSEEIARVQILYDHVNDMEFASSRELQSIVKAIDSDHVVCFAFNIGGDQDHTLKSMQSHSQKEMTLEESSACVSVKPWYTNTDLMEAILRRIEQFKSFAKENKRKAVRFVVTNNSHKGGEIGSILLYKGNTSEVFEPPSAPGKPTASNVTQDKVQLEWTKPDYGSKNIHCYNISYYPTDNPKSYKTVSTNSAEKTATISGLTAGTGYVFKVQPECVCGVGTESEASDRIETQIVSSPPTNSNVEGTVCSTKPVASVVTHNSIQLKWTPPQTCNGNIECYTIFYRLANNPNSKWKRKNTENDEQTLTVTGLTPDTSYIFKVRPEMEDGCVGTESEISDPITTNKLARQPGNLSSVTVTKTSIQLEWTKPECDSDKVQCYTIFYRLANDPNSKWKRKNTDSDEETLAVTGLIPDTSYVFKVRPEMEDGSVGTESEVSNPIKTASNKLVCQPGKPTISPVNVMSNSVQVNWTKPEINSDKIQCYTVLYRLADDPNGKWKMENTDSDEKTLHITGLTPDTKYVFKVRPELDNGVGSESEISDPIKTNILLCQPGKPTAAVDQVTHDSIRICWTKPEVNSDSVQCYTIMYRQTYDQRNTWKRKNTEGTEETLTITELSPDTSYIFKVRPELDNRVGSESEISDPIKTKKMSCRPGKPKASESTITHNSVKLSWCKPDASATNIQCYTVLYRLADDPNGKWKIKNTDSDEKTLHITGLTPDTKYVFKVRPELDNGVGSESEISDPIKTNILLCQPGKPTAAVDQVTHDSIRICWTKPEVNSDSVQCYTILYHQTYNQRNTWKRKNTEGTEETLTITGLSPDTSYIFKVRPELDGKVGIESESSDPINTKATSPPGKPTATETDITYNTVTLKWKKPEHGMRSEKIESYRILYYTQSEGEEKIVQQTNALQETAVVTGLLPRTKYKFKVQCNSRHNFGSFSEWSDSVVTKATSPPGRPTASAVHCDKIELKWDRPEIGGENIKHYIVMFYKASHSVQTPILWKTHIALDPHDQESVIVDKLDVYSGYKFKIYPECGDDGDGTESEISDTIYTKATSPPDKPKATTNVTHDSIEIQWTPPKYGSENISSYTVYYRCCTDTQDLQWKTQETSNLSFCMTISGLKCNSSYCFKLHPQCTSVKSEGTDSMESDIINTKSTSPPGKPRTIVEKTTHDSITVQWSHPRLGSDNVEGYKVLYKLANNQSNKWCDTQVAGKNNTYKLKQLSPNTSYIFKVQVLCKSGNGTISKISDEVTTKPVCQPGKPIALSITYNTITLKWKKPEFYNQHVKQYQIKYRKIKSSLAFEKSDIISATNDPAENQTAVVKDLDHNTSYYFFVVPTVLSEKLIVLHSEESDAIKTKATSPPGQPQCVTATFDTINVKWAEPSTGASNVRNYTVFCYTGNQECKQMETSNHQPEAVVKALTPSTQYIFKVQPNCFSGIGSTSNESKPIATEATCKPGKPNATKITHDSVYLAWDKPKSHGKSVEHYVVSYREYNDPQKVWRPVALHNSSNVRVTNLFLHIIKLTPNTKYVFKVYPHCKGSKTIGQLESISDPITTKVTSPPNKPTASSIKHDSIEIKWTKPHVGSKNIKCYLILCEEVSNAKTIPTTLKADDSEQSLLIQNLSINTGYRFKIHPECGENGVGSESEFSNVINTRATSPPGQPVATNKTHDSIKIEWTRPDTGYQNVKSYSLYYTEVANMHNMSTEKWKCIPNIKPEKLHRKISNLSLQTSYIVLIRPECNSGVGSDSELSIPIETNATSPPGKPIEFRTTHDSIAIKCEKPESGSQHIKGYNIMYRPVKDHGQLEEWEQNTCNVQTYYTIGGLEINTPYQFKIIPKCEAGVGTESVTSDSIWTKATSPPSKPTALDEDVTHDSITLRWSKPEYGGYNVKGYTVRYWLLEEKKKVSTQKCEGTNESMTIHGLETKRYYQFKVCSECTKPLSGSESEESDPVRTKPVCKPGTITATNVTHNSIKLEWNKPEFGSEDIDYYVVSCRIHKSSYDEETWEPLRTSSQEAFITATNLSPNTKYIFKVLPHLCTTGSNAVEAIQTYSTIIQTQDRPLAERLQDKWKKHMIKEGDPPYICNVPVKKHVVSNMISKCVIAVGNHTPGQKGRVLMLVGATGAGKSTLINSIVNYIYGVRWEDPFRFMLISGESAQSQAHSQTAGITAYTFYPINGSPLDYVLTIVDTPGFGDTRGLERDNAITKNIKEFFSVNPPNGIDQIHAIGFVAQAALARLTPTQKYIFESILAMFGKDIANNIFLMSTFADGQAPQVLEAIKEARIECSHAFKFNNSALLAKPGAGNFDQLFWTMNSENLQNFFSKLECAEARTLQLTQEVLQTREELETSVQGLQKQLEAGLGLITELQQEEKILEQHAIGTDITSMKSAKYEVEVTKRVEVPLEKGQFVTNCIVCNFTCHIPCTISDDNKKYKCAAMGGGWLFRGKKSTCTVCPRNCSWESHKNRPFKYELQIVRETRTYEDLIRKYTQEEGQLDQSEKETAEQVKSKISNRLKEVNDHVLELIKKIRTCVEKLEEIALRPAPLNEVSYIELMIESERKEGREGFQQRIATLQQLKKKARILSEATKANDEGSEKTQDQTPWWKFWEKIGNN